MAGSLTSFLLWSLSLLHFQLNHENALISRAINLIWSLRVSTLKNAFVILIDDESFRTFSFCRKSFEMKSVWKVESISNLWRKRIDGETSFVMQKSNASIFHQYLCLFRTEIRTFSSSFIKCWKVDNAPY